MKPLKPADRGQGWPLRTRQDRMISMDDGSAAVAGCIGGNGPAERCGEVYSDKPGHPPL